MRKLVREIWLPPNLVSLFRLFVCTYFVCMYVVFENYHAAGIWYAVGAATDWLDGWLARTFGWITDTGKGLDPIADKIFYLGSVLFLVGFAVHPLIIFLLGVLLGLEAFLLCIGVHGLKLVIQFEKKGRSTEQIKGANSWGKRKAFCEIIFTALILGAKLGIDLGIMPLILALVLAIVFAGLSISGHLKDMKLL